MEHVTGGAVLPPTPEFTDCPDCGNRVFTAEMVVHRLKHAYHRGRLDGLFSGDHPLVSDLKAKRLVIHPGESILVALPQGTDDELVERFAGILKKALPDGTGFAVWREDGGYPKVTVVARGEDDGG